MHRYQKRPWRRLAIIVSLLIIALVGCNYPGLRSSGEPAAGAIYTSAALTVQAQATQLLPLTAAAFTPTATWPASESSPTATPLGATSVPPSATAPVVSRSSGCDQVKFIKDLTIPDGTKLDPGASFVKTWRLQNAGSCTWDPSYSLVVEGDNDLNAPQASPLNTVVPPGETIDISITLTAPQSSGSYRQNFKLANAAGQRFGLGEEMKPFWVQIEVRIPGGITLDFLSLALNAEWKSGVENNFDTLVAFDGPDDDPNGAAKIKNQVKLETGSISGKILLTVPKHAPNGVIAGVYPAYTVQTGDHLLARLGFMANADGACGVGNVTFQVLYLQNNQTTSLGSWAKTCNGLPQKIDINLAQLVGQNVQFVLLVRANGDYQDAWAVWNSARIER